MIVEQTGADSFEILPKEDKYPMTYKELNNNARPEIKDTLLIIILSFLCCFINY